MTMTSSSSRHSAKAAALTEPPTRAPTWRLLSWKKRTRVGPGAKDRVRGPSSEASKDELLSQQSRPRFVNAQSTIYELRKRTGAILEWLGRTQMELEEERSAPLFDENLRLMERLTEKILAWEQRFGKYAP